jgi:Mce-associated membrane protein
VVLLLASGAAAYWTWRGRATAQAAAGDREEALRAAGTYAVNLLSVSHRTVDEDLRRILDTSTGEARAENTRTAAAVKAATLKDKAVETGVLRSAAIDSIDGATAEVLVVADAVIRWEGDKKLAPEERFYRWRMRVAKVNGVWLVGKAEMVS